MINFTTYQYIASVTLNNRAADRKAQACPLVHRFGGEKRIKYIGDHLIRTETYGALNAHCLENKLGFSEPVKMDVAGQTAEQKRERWRKNWCRVRLFA